MGWPDAPTTLLPGTVRRTFPSTDGTLPRLSCNEIMLRRETVARHRVIPWQVHTESPGPKFEMYVLQGLLTFPSGLPPSRTARERALAQRVTRLPGVARDRWKGHTVHMGPMSQSLCSAECAAVAQALETATRRRCALGWAATCTNAQAAVYPTDNLGGARRPRSGTPPSTATGTGEDASSPGLPTWSARPPRPSGRKRRRGWTSRPPAGSTSAAGGHDRSRTSPRLVRTGGSPRCFAG